MLSSTPVVDRRFGLLRLAAYIIRGVALLLLLASLMGILAFGLALFQIPDFAPFAASFTVVQVGVALLGALGVAAIAEVYLVLLAIEENTRASAAAAYAVAQAQQKQAEAIGALTAIAQNTRFAADDLLKAGKLLEQIADEQRRGHAALPELTTQVKELVGQGRNDSARLTTLEAIARAAAQRFLGPQQGGPPAP